VIELMDMLLLALMAVVAVVVARLRNLFAVVMVFGFFSLLSAALFLVLDAVDVSFTEAAVGAGASTVLLLGALLLTDREEKPPTRFSPWPFLVVAVTGATLVYGTLDMPHYGDPSAPIHQHVAPRYINQSPEEIGVPNMVTSVLASYRGYDTLGETTVIFTAGLGLLLLIGQSFRFRDKEGTP
jgi:multicomponent Na+:H+ antiporter subunit B